MTHKSRGLARCEARTVDALRGRFLAERCLLRGELHTDTGLILCHQHVRRYERGREIEPCFVECTYINCVCPVREARTAPTTESQEERDDG